MSPSPSTCSHAWVDPRERWITKAPYAPMIGEQRRQMKWDTEYRCNNCGAVLKTPPTPPRPTDADNRDP